MLQILITSVILLGISMVGMFLNIIIRKNGKFPAYRVGHNKDMKKMGISCVKTEEIKCHKKQNHDCGACNILIDPES